MFSFALAIVFTTYLVLQRVIPATDPRLFGGTVIAQEALGRDWHLLNYDFSRNPCTRIDYLCPGASTDHVDQRT